MPKTVQLYCECKNYDWGSIGNDSIAAQLAESNFRNLKTSQIVKNAEFKIEPSKNYAEMWMGAHPSGPSRNVYTGTALNDILTQDHNINNKLPFLFKILSISKALSIQAHPDKRLAKYLHQKDPINYKDDNHKPEMTIALNDFYGLCGFRPIPQIQYFFKHVKAFATLLSQEVVDWFCALNSKQEQASDSLKKIFTLMMNCSRVDDAITELLNDIQHVKLDSEIQCMVKSLNQQFPGDIGVFCIFVLNLVHLKKGEAMFLEANVAHAYIKGDILECMASSDNVVRAAFTSKYKDVNVLLDMLDYRSKNADDYKVSPEIVKTHSGHCHCLLYSPPVEEFSVMQSILAADQNHHFGSASGASILLVYQGSGHLINDEARTKIFKGSVTFIAANTNFEIQAAQSLTCFIAFNGVLSKIEKAD